MALRLMAGAMRMSSTSLASVRHFAKKAKGGKAAPTAAAASAGSSDDEAAGFEQTLTTAKKNMQGGVQNFTRQLNQMRPGKADAGIFDELHIQAYGQHVPLSQLAQVSVSGTHSLTVTVYDPSVLAVAAAAAVHGFFLLLTLWWMCALL